MPARTPDRWVKASREHGREGCGRLCEAARVAVEGLQERDGPRRRGGREALEEVLPEQVDVLVTAAPSRRRCAGTRPPGFPRPVRWRLAMVDAQTIVGDTTYGHRFTSGPLRSAGRFGVPRDVARRRRRARPGRPLCARSSQSLDALGELERPDGVLKRSSSWSSTPSSSTGETDERILQLPRQVIETTIQHHIRAFPLGRPLRVRRERRRSGDGAARSRTSSGRPEDASFTFERDLKVGSTVSRSGSCDHAFAGGGS